MAQITWRTLDLGGSPTAAVKQCWSWHPPYNSPAPCDRAGARRREKKRRLLSEVRGSANELPVMGSGHQPRMMAEAERVEVIGRLARSVLHFQDSVLQNPSSPAGLLVQVTPTASVTAGWRELKLLHRKSPLLRLTFAISSPPSGLAPREERRRDCTTHEGESYASVLT